MVDGNAVKLFSCSARDVRLARAPIVSGSVLKAFPFNVSFSNLPASQTLRFSKAYSLHKARLNHDVHQHNETQQDKANELPFACLMLIWTY